jgi:redox-sensing transcriptional repressor
MSRGDSGRERSSGEARPSRATARRLSLYLRHLEPLLREGIAKVSSGQLGDALGVTDAQVRKDFAYLGGLGHPGVGYPTEALIGAIRRALGIDRQWKVAIVGVGNLARALLRYRGFRQQGFRIVALFDIDPDKVGQRVEGLEVYPTERMPAVIAETRAELGLITVPAEAAQTVADGLGAAGVQGLLNFAPVVVRPPRGVSLVSVDLAIQLEQLAFLVQMRGAD